jgi:hypothetical protein
MARLTPRDNNWTKRITLVCFVVRFEQERP